VSPGRRAYWFLLQAAAAFAGVLLGILIYNAVTR
jgi:hypothetical protein